MHFRRSFVALFVLMSACSPAEAPVDAKDQEHTSHVAGAWVASEPLPELALDGVEPERPVEGQPAVIRFSLRNPGTRRLNGYVAAVIHSRHATMNVGEWALVDVAPGNQETVHGALSFVAPRGGKDIEYDLVYFEGYSYRQGGEFMSRTPTPPLVRVRGRMEIATHYRARLDAFKPVEARSRQKDTLYASIGSAVNREATYTTTAFLGDFGDANRWMPISGVDPKGRPIDTLDTDTAEMVQSANSKLRIAYSLMNRGTSGQETAREVMNAISEATNAFLSVVYPQASDGWNKAHDFTTRLNGWMTGTCDGPVAVENLELDWNKLDAETWPLNEPDIPFATRSWTVEAHHGGQDYASQIGCGATSNYDVRYTIRRSGPEETFDMSTADAGSIVMPGDNVALEAPGAVNPDFSVVSGTHQGVVRGSTLEVGATIDGDEAIIVRGVERTGEVGPRPREGLLAVHARPRDVVRNGDFKQSGGWLQPWARNQGAGIAGRNAATIVASGGVGELSQWVDVTPGMTYRVSAWIRTSAEATGGRLAVRASETTSPSDPTVRLGPTPNGIEYRELTVQVETQTRLYLSLAVQGPDGASLQVSQVRMEAVIPKARLEPSITRALDESRLFRLEEPSGAPVAGGVVDVLAERRDHTVIARARVETDARGRIPFPPHTGVPGEPIDVTFAFQGTTRIAPTTVRRRTLVPVASPMVLHVARIGNGRIIGPDIACGRRCAASFPASASVTLEATPEPGWTFTGWSGACSGSANVCSVTMAGSRDVSASFRRTNGPESPYLTIDAATLSTPAFRVYGGPDKVFDGRSPQPVDLAPGTYFLQFTSGALTPFSFTVTSEGTFDYDASAATFLDGRGTTALHVGGFPVDLDATQLSTNLALIDFDDPNFLEKGIVQHLRLAPASYGFLVGSARTADFTFSVDDRGRIGYPGWADAFAAGAGSSTLKLRGYPVSVTVSSSATGWMEPGLFGLPSQPFPARAPTTLSLLPTTDRTLQIFAGAMVTGGWRIDRNGALDFAPVLDAFLSGRGTRTLTAKGLPITIDATAEGPGTFQITTVLGLDSISRAVPQTLSLLPSVAHRFLSDKHSFVFSVTPNGSIEFAPTLDSVVRGRGTRSLTLLPTARP